MTKTNQTPSLYTLQFLATVLIFTLLATNTAQAQLLVDVEAPIIELEALAETEADGSQVFSALVADDQQLKDVTLYHRRSGQQAFTRQDMEPLGDTGYYSATLTTDPSDLRAIEYYLQARDEGGNRTVSGYAFDPYHRLLTRASSRENSEPWQPAISNQPVAKTPRRWWAVALGVLAVGVLAAAAGGGDNSEESGRVPVTIDIIEPVL